MQDCFLGRACFIFSWLLFLLFVYVSLGVILVKLVQSRISLSFAFVLDDAWLIFSFFVSFRVFFAISSNFLYQTANWILPSVTIPFQEEFLFQTETFIASKKKSGLVDSFSSDRELVRSNWPWFPRTCFVFTSYELREFENMSRRFAAKFRSKDHETFWTETNSTKLLSNSCRLSCGYLFLIFLLFVSELQRWRDS